MDKTLTKQQDEFLNGNLWKVIIKMMIPTMVMMLFFGIYSFSDTIISIHFLIIYKICNLFFHLALT